MKPLNKWTVVVRQAAKKSGEEELDFGFLADWRGRVDESALRSALRRFAARYSTAVHVRNAKHVLLLWVADGAQHGWLPPAVSNDAVEVTRQLTDLRRTLFQREAARGLLLTSINAQWRSFLALLEEFVAAKVLPPIDTMARSMRPVPQSLTQIHRERAISLPARERPKALSPQSFVPERDSYNDDLLESISIAAADAAYLDEYEHRLGGALDVFRRCALSDFEGMVAKRSLGLTQLQKVDPLQLARVAEGQTRLVGSSHPFTETSAHPNFIGNLLWLVDHYMGGLPRPFDSRAAVSTREPPYYWIHVRRFGKNRLLPYLGLLSASAAAVCCVLLLVEHPQLNPSSLARARLTDREGRPVLLLDAGQDGEALRLVTKKPRARAEKAVLLSPLARRVIEHLVEWTRPVREEMIRQGRRDEASRLWVGMNSMSCDVIAFSERAIYSAFKLPKSKTDWTDKPRSTRAVPFLSRHPELARWASGATFKSLRVSAGVLRYLQSGGDLVAAAEAFGHKTVKTTLSHYIPPSLRDAIFERQIRRHQNLLIVASADSERDAINASDFGTVEELHAFLRTLLHSSEDGSGGEAVALWRTLAGREPESPPGAEAADLGTSQIALTQDPKGIAIAILYREHLRNAPAASLAREDAATRIAPQFWIDFVDCITGRLPTAMHEIGQLVRHAQVLVPTIRGTVRFPALAA